MFFCIIIQIKRSRETFLKLSFFFVEEKTLVTWNRRNNHVNNHFRTIFFFFWVLKALNTNRMLENGHVFPHQVTIDFTTINADTFKMLSISTEPKSTKKKHSSPLRSSRSYPTSTLQSDHMLSKNAKSLIIISSIWSVQGN